MALALYILRHAKSAWDDPALADIDRPLNPRGRRAAAAMGAHMQQQGLIPEKVLLSPARRTRETWNILSSQWKAPPPAEIIEALYDFGDGTPLLTAARENGGAAQSLMLVSHDPSVHRLSNRLVSDGDKELRQALAERYPTGALAVIALPALQWADIAERSGTLLQFIRPRLLMGE